MDGNEIQMYKWWKKDEWKKKDCGVVCTCMGGAVWLQMVLALSISLQSLS